MAVLKFDVHAKEFKFGRVSDISKVWIENDYWVVNTLVEYSLDQAQMITMTFQVDLEGKILGYDTHAPLPNMPKSNLLRIACILN